MPKHQETRVFSYSQSQLFALVADIEHYHEFLPWVIGTRIREHLQPIEPQEQTIIVADLIVGFKIFRENFTSKVTLTPNDHIHVDYIKGPLRYLHNDWYFKPLADGSTKVDFSVDFAFNNPLFERLVGAMFTQAVEKMVHAFEKRAERLYGSLK